MPTIQTATKEEDKFGADRHGFTGGDPQSGVAPTQLSAAWCDGVQEEINNVIVYGEQTIDNDGPYIGMREAVKKRIKDQRVDDVLTFRVTQVPDQPNWLVRRNTISHEAVPRGNTYAVSITLPDNSQATATFTVQCLRQGSLTARANAIVVASVRQVAGTAVVQSQTPLLSDINITDVTFLVVASGASVRGTLTIQNTSPDDDYNIFMTAEVNNVTAS